ncbi:hypothetical protein H0516_21140 [Pantoea stewartii]|nr:hypothetical protein [Pantoea stewartii]
MSLSFSKSVELHDKVIGYCLNTNTINKRESLPQSSTSLRSAAETAGC